MKELDIKEIRFVSGDSGSFAIYNDVYYKINNTARIIIEDLQNGYAAIDIAAKYQITEDDISKLLETFKQKKKGNIFGKIVLLPKVACNQIGSLLRFLCPNKSLITLSIIIFYIVSIFLSFHFSTPIKNISILEAFLVFFIILFWHELGHISAAYKMGIKDLQIRLGFYLIFPVTHVDMNSIYKLTHKQRVMIDMGGLYFQMILGLFFFFLSLYSDNSLFTLAFEENLMIIIYNLIPYQISDGHWIYSDYFEIDNLNSKSEMFAKSLFKKELRNDNITMPVKVYSVFNTVFITLLTGYSVVILWLRCFTFSEIYDNLVTSNFAISEVLKACWLLYPYCLLFIFIIIKINGYSKNMVKSKK